MPSDLRIQYVCAAGHTWDSTVDAPTLDGSEVKCPACGEKGVASGDGGTLHQDPAAILRTSDGMPLPTVPGYRVIREVGRGAMGVVYEAVHEGLRRTVALKMVLNASYAGPERKARFLVEGEMLARLSHPNVVQIFEVGHCDGVPYFALEYVAGGNLGSHLANQPQAPADAAVLVATLARAVAHAHAQGVVHRDLKPANVLLSDASATLGTAKVTDFGLARSLDEGATLTGTGGVVGTPAYMAPEQAAGQPRVGPAADVYGLGAILYECLTGRPPFLGYVPAAVMQQVLQDEPTAPHKVQPGVPRDLEVICLKCLAKDPAQRYPTAAALADELERYGRGEPIKARPAGVAERAWRWGKRNPAVAALLALLAVTIASGAAGVLWKYREAEAERHEAVYLARLAEDRAAQLNRALAEADRNYGMARDAVDRYLTGVSSSDALKATTLAPLRKTLLETAREFYQKFADERKNDPDSRAGLIGAYLKLAELARIIEQDAKAAVANAEKALDLSRAAVAARPEDGAAHGNLVESQRQIGLAHDMANDFGPAAAAWDAAAAAGANAARLPGIPPSDRVLFAWTYVEAGRSRQAAKAFAPAGVAFGHARTALTSLAAEPTTAESVAADVAWLSHYVGLLRTAEKRDADAETAFRDAAARFEAMVAAYPKKPEYLSDAGEAHDYRGLTLARLGRLDDAVASHERAIAHHTDSLNRRNLDTTRLRQVRAYRRLCETLLKQGRYARAAVEAETMAQLRPTVLQDRIDAADVLKRCGTAAKRGGNATGAAEYLTAARRTLAGIATAANPTKPLDQNNLAWAFAASPEPELRQPARAVFLADKATQAAPTEGIYWNTLGVALARAGDDRAARRALQKSMSLRNGGDAFDWYFLAQIAARAGDAADARRWLEKAVAFHDALPPDSDDRTDLDRFRAESQAALERPAAAKAELSYEVVAGLDAAALKAFAVACRADGRRVMRVTGFGVGDRAEFAAVAERGDREVVWNLFLERGPGNHQIRVEGQMKGEGLVVVGPVSVYPAGGGVNGYASLWQSNPAAYKYEVRSSLPAATARQYIAGRKSLGYRLEEFAGYVRDGALVYATRFAEDRGRPWEYVDSTPDLDAAVTAAKARGLRPISLGRVPAGAGTAFAAVFAADDDIDAWEYRHGLTAEALASEQAKWSAAGYRPDVLLGYEDAGASRYAAVWVREKAATR